MNRNLIYLLLLQLTAFCSCVETYDLNLKSKEKKLIVEGLISDIADRDHNYIKLTKSSENIILQYSPSVGGYDSTIAINNALVIISDEYNNRDTLIQPSAESWQYIINDDETVIDSFFGQDKHYNCGFYYPEKFSFEHGQTYSLIIMHNNKEYHAQSTMLFTPEIDSINYKYTQGEPGKNDYLVPHIYFKDSKTTTNYYLFDFSGNGWGISLLDNQFLGDYIAGLDIFRGQQVDWWRTSYPMPGDRFKIEMQCVSKECYDFYKASINVFGNDGGAYHPSPATAPSNIDNGALGFFRAVSIKKTGGNIPYIK